MSEETLPRFRYLHEKSHYWYETDPKPCVVCAQERARYGFMDMESERYESHIVCETCLLSGRLAEVGMSINAVDAEDLREQLAELHPELSAEEQESLAVERTAEVQQRTPRPDLSNLFTWPAHCGDYLIYCYQVNADALNVLALDGDGRAFFEAAVQTDRDDKEGFLAEAWEEKLEGFWEFYLWQCPVCEGYLLTYTCE